MYYLFSSLITKIHHFIEISYWYWDNDTFFFFIFHSLSVIYSDFNIYFYGLLSTENQIELLVLRYHATKLSCTLSYLTILHFLVLRLMNSSCWCVKNLVVIQSFCSRAYWEMYSLRDMSCSLIDLKQQNDWTKILCILVIMFLYSNGNKKKKWAWCVKNGSKLDNFNLTVNLMRHCQPLLIFDLNILISLAFYHTYKDFQSKVISKLWKWVCIFNSKSTFVGYLMPEASLYKESSSTIKLIARGTRKFIIFPTVLIQK